MTKRRMVLALALCSLVALLAVQALSQTRKARPPERLDHERLQNMTEEEREKELQKRQIERELEFERLRNMSEPERKRYLEKRRKQRELERQRESRKRRAERERERAPMREQRRLDMAQRRKEYEKEKEEAGGFRLLAAKHALGLPEEQWKLIQAKLQRVQNLRDQANSVVGASISGGSSDSRTGESGPAFQWKRPWKDKPLKELTEAQRLARQLRMLLEKKDTTQQAFRHKMAALRKARIKEAEIERQLAEARRDLRQVLTTRQEAVLVLMKWL